MNYELLWFQLRGILEETKTEDNKLDIGDMLTIMDEIEADERASH